jgi:hypothetical protein
MSDSTLWAELIARTEATFTSTEMPDGASSTDVQDLLIAVSRSASGEWSARADEILGAADAGREDFTRALREQWGPSLDALQLFIEGAEQFGADFVTSQPRDNKTVLTEIVLTLHAAACVCAHEIDWLLRGGYPTGAESRSRTLHEIAMTTLVLADHCGEDDDLIQRYLDHKVVSDWRYWNYIAQHHADVGTEEPDAAFIARLQTQIDELTARYSKAFKNDYGWAIPLVAEGKLEEVEKLVGRGDRRALYKVASSQAVHANSGLLTRHYVERAGGPERLSNATTTGLARPAAVAAHCLWDTCSAVAGAAKRQDSYATPLGLMALRLLRDDVVQKLIEVDEAVP